MTLLVSSGAVVCLLHAVLWLVSLFCADELISVGALSRIKGRVYAL